jgi:hypothetical protein
MSITNPCTPRNKFTTPIRAQGGGYVAEGPGFYIWDEDVREVLRVARELARGNLNVSPTTRLLVIPSREGNAS